MSNTIDFVMTWVDGNDPEWQEEKAKYTKDTSGDKRNIRFRDWDNLQYWFRGIETFAPWVNKIHFVTWGHVPSWLNVDHPKLNIVNHRDFIPHEYLPTFSSRAIEVNLHRIPGLADQFVYFNDDTFLTRKVRKEDFFKKGLPCDVAVPYPCSSTSRLGIGAIISNNMEIINTTFNKRKSIKKNFFKWYNPFLYKRHFISVLSMIPYGYFTSFLSTHIPHSYLKSTFEEVWEKEEEILKKTSANKFRDKGDVNQWLMRYWQLASGNFAPRNINDGKLFMLTNNNDLALSAIRNQKHKMICINDRIDIHDFERQKKLIQDAFESILPKKSDFEL